MMADFNSISPNDAPVKKENWANIKSIVSSINNDIETESNPKTMLYQLKLKNILSKPNIEPLITTISVITGINRIKKFTIKDPIDSDRILNL